MIGCEDWSVKISLVEIESNTLLSVWNYDCDGPISRVQLFYLSNYFPPDAEGKILSPVPKFCRFTHIQGPGLENKKKSKLYLR